MNEQVKEGMKEGSNACRPIAEGCVGFDVDFEAILVGLQDSTGGLLRTVCVPDPRARHVFHECMNK